MLTQQFYTREDLIQNNRVLVFRVDRPELSSKQLLQQVLQLCVKIKLLPFVPTVVHHNKPYFQEMDDVHFNISHTRDMWICAFSAYEIGIDIEQHRPCDTLSIAQRFFHQEELVWLQNHPDDFFFLWTRKESAVKLTSEGFSTHFKETNICPHIESKYLFYPLDLPDNFNGTLCSFNPILSIHTQTFQKELP